MSNNLNDQTIEALIQTFTPLQWFILANACMFSR